MDRRTIVVQKRFGDEQLDVREFVRPDTYMVWKLASQLEQGNRTDSYIQSCWQYVVHRIRYPDVPYPVLDWHELQAYGSPGHAKIRYQTNDFWNYPSETLRDGMGDCDDKSILLCSLLRRQISSRLVFCTVGKLQECWHMWVTFEQHGKKTVLETTREQPAVDEAQYYQPYFRFNDKAVVVTRQFGDIPPTHGREG